jgi:TPR repeat protein
VPDNTEAKANPPAAVTKQSAPTKQASNDADADSDSSSDDAEDTAATAPAKPKPATTDAAPKPSAAQRSAGTVAEAQKYLYGKGAKQDCDRGLRLLKPAADRADPKAMIEMGALYSAGLCTPRDLPTAYRWFAMALHKDPDNQGVQNDLQKLWGEMTQPERQLAIKLSQ